MALFHGSRLRELRKNKSISIAELSKLSDVSTGLISQIEREMVIPSVVSIWRLAQALDTNINYFFDEDDVDDKVIIRKNDHRAVILHSNSSYYKLLSPASPERLLDMTEITLKSGCAYEQIPSPTTARNAGMCSRASSSFSWVAKNMCSRKATAFISTAPCRINTSTAATKTASRSGR